MSGLFGKPKTPPPPKPVRMPVEQDPDVLAAQRRVQESALRRQGRLSTILTDSNQAAAGYRGEATNNKLGASDLA